MSNDIGYFENKTHPKDFTLKRTIQAPRKLVFECLTTPEHLVCFWAPKPLTTHDCKVDLRPGGKWTYIFRSPEGQEYRAQHVYREIESFQKLIMDGSGLGLDDKALFTIRQTILLQDKGLVTELKIDIKVLEVHPGSEPYLEGAYQGFNMTLDNFQAYLVSRFSTS